MTATAPLEFSYRDKKLGDTQAVSVVTAPDVFHPTSTTVLLLRAARRALAQGPSFPVPGGRRVFPVLTSARESAVLERARARFAAVEQVEEQWYPLGEELLAHGAEIEALAAAGSVRLERRGSRWCWATRVFVAY